MAARKPSDRRHGGEDEIPELNLVPIMAIMVILIPMIIFIFTFSQIKVQRVMAPRRGTGAKKSAEENKQKELNLTIMIKQDKGFLLTWEEALMTETAQAPLLPMRQVDGKLCDTEHDGTDRAQGCWDKNGLCSCYDFPALYNQLVDKKQKFSTPEAPEKRVNITADRNVPWEVVSRTIDAASCMLEQPSYTNFEDYHAARPKKGEQVKVPGMDDPVQMCEELFPNVVFAMAE